ncbi:MAG: hypothetical protein ACUVS2_13555 [Candidatus Flexifilum sp.]|jgi:hypothetical protein
MSAEVRLLYTTTVRRGKYVRLFLRTLLGSLAAIAAYLVLEEVAARGLIDPVSNAALIDLGRTVAIVVAAWLGARAVYHLVLALVRRTETISVYHQGIAWGTKSRSEKRGWSQVATFRESARALRVFGLTLAQWGAHVLRFDDETVLRFRPYHGDPRQFARVVRPYAARITSSKMGQQLREERPVRLHPRLTVYPGGIEAGSKEIHWDDLHLRVEHHRLVVRQRDAERQARGKMPWRVIRRYPLAQVDNVAGLLELWKGVQQVRQAAQQRARQQAQLRLPR